MEREHVGNPRKTTNTYLFIEVVWDLTSKPSQGLNTAKRNRVLFPLDLAICHLAFYFNTSPSKSQYARFSEFLSVAIEPENLLNLS